MQNPPVLKQESDSPLSLLEMKLSDETVKIETWFRKQWRDYQVPLTTSVDIRNAGYKMAVIDTNLFPAGFNNIHVAQIPLAHLAVQQYWQHYMPQCERIVLIPENHSRNGYYFKSLLVLSSILTKAGFEVKIASIDPSVTAAKTLAVEDGEEFTLYPLERNGNRVHIGDFKPCTVVLNNDLSEGIPDILTGITQAIYPPLALGWASRLKSEHFLHYQTVCHAFAELLSIDPWLLNPLFRQCSDINFMEHEGEDCLAKHVEFLLAAIQKKYDEYTIKDSPFVIVKADSGTYGMGIMTIKSVEEVYSMNRKARTRMSVGKGRQPITSVLIQEGVYSYEVDSHKGAIAEPVVYMLGQCVVGGFYRLHEGRANNENLNSPGMYFEPIPFAGACNNPLLHDAHSRRLYAYSVLARLALLASAYELRKVL
ncbi:MAG: transporter ATP-binding protein [Gammaproteobacteria bacterium]|nr:transporter ATP-binding protein [Gammaproteobacteria bacterium]